MTPTVLFFISFAIIAVYLSIVAYGSGFEINSNEDYLFAKDIDTAGLNSRQAWMAAVVTNFQTASVLIFNLQFGFQYGLTMIWAPATFSFGVILLWLMLKKSQQTKRKYPPISQDLPYNRILAKLSKAENTSVNILIYLAILSTAFLEIWLSIEFVENLVVPAFNIFGTGDVIARPSVYIVSIVLVALLFIYTIIGGYRAVVRTDPVQFALIGAMLLILLFGTLIKTLDSASINFSSLLYGTEGPKLVDSITFWSLIIGIFSLNIFWQFVDPQQWQRARAAESDDIYINSLPKNAIVTCATWISPVIAGGLLASSGTNESSLAAAIPFLSLVNTLFAYEYTKWFAPIVLAISVGGIFAASLSSAEPAILAFLSRFAQKDGHNITLHQLRVRAASLLFIVVILSSALYVLNPEIKNVIFAIYTGIIIFAGSHVKAIILTRPLNRSRMREISICSLFVLFSCFAIALNMVPSISLAFPSAANILPLIVLLIGFLLA